MDADVMLPPITQETVLLDLDPIVLKSYNALQAAVAVNAIDSERKDQASTLIEVLSNWYLCSEAFLGLPFPPFSK